MATPVFTNVFAISVMLTVLGIIVIALFAHYEDDYTMFLVKTFIVIFGVNITIMYITDVMMKKKYMTSPSDVKTDELYDHMQNEHAKIGGDHISVMQNAPVLQPITNTPNVASDHWPQARTAGSNAPNVTYQDMSSFQL